MTKAHLYLVALGQGNQEILLIQQDSHETSSGKLAMKKFFDECLKYFLPLQDKHESIHIKQDSQESLLINQDNEENILVKQDNQEKKIILIFHMS